MVDTYHFGKMGYLALALQNIEGTQETDFDTGIPIEAEPSIKAVVDKKYPKEYRKVKADKTSFIRTSIKAEGDFEVSAYPGSGLEHILYGISGDQTHVVVADTTSAYTNTYTMVDTLPMFSVAVGRDELNMETFKDMRIGSADFTFKPGEDVKVKASMMGKPTGIGSSDITPDYGANRQFIFDDVAVSLGGAPNCDVKEVSLKIDRGLKSLRTTCAAAGRGDNKFYSTTVNVEGSITMLFQDYTEYKYWLGAAAATDYDWDADVTSMARALVIEATGEPIGDGAPVANDKLTLTVHKIVYDDADIKMPYDDLMEVTFKFVGMYDGTKTAGNEVISMVLISEMDGVVSPA